MLVYRLLFDFIDDSFAPGLDSWLDLAAIFFYLEVVPLPWD